MASNTKTESGVFIAGAGVLAIIIGSFLPWATITAPFIGTVTKSGTEGAADGWVTLALGALAAMVLVSVWRAAPERSARAGRVAIALLGFAAGILAVYELSDLTKRFADIKNSTSADISVSTSVGTGLVLVTIGAVVLLIGGIVMWINEPVEVSEAWSGPPGTQPPVT